MGYCIKAGHTDLDISPKEQQQTEKQQEMCKYRH